VRQWLWGRGFVTPGGRDEVLSLVGPLRLGPAMTFLDVAAGLGGAVRAVAESLNVDAVGYERDLALVHAGMALSTEYGFARRAPVRVFDPESFDLPPARYDGALAREATYAVRDKERFLRVVKQGLKPMGSLVFADFVLDRGADGAAALADWAPLPDVTPALWTRERYEDCLKSLGFEFLAVADTSDAYRALVMEGWEALTHRDELHRLPRLDAQLIIDQAERWTRTIQALDSGALRMIRIEAGARPLY
jgi:SAM-dependent methyltransferase